MFNRGFGKFHGKIGINGTVFRQISKSGDLATLKSAFTDVAASAAFSKLVTVVRHRIMFRCVFFFCLAVERSQIFKFYLVIRCIV